MNATDQKKTMSLLLVGFMAGGLAIYGLVKNDFVAVLGAIGMAAAFVAGIWAVAPVVQAKKEPQTKGVK